LADAQLRPGLDFAEYNQKVSTGLLYCVISASALMAGGHGGGGAYDFHSNTAGSGGLGNVLISSYAGGNARASGNIICPLGGGGGGGGGGESGHQPKFFSVAEFEAGIIAGIDNSASCDPVTFNLRDISQIHCSNLVMVSAQGGDGTDVDQCFLVTAGGGGAGLFYANNLGLFGGTGGNYGGGHSSTITNWTANTADLNLGGGGGGGRNSFRAGLGASGSIVLKYHKQYELLLDPGGTYVTDQVDDTVMITTITSGLGNMKFKLSCFPYVKTVCSPRRGPTFPVAWFIKGG